MKASECLEPHELARYHAENLKKIAAVIANGQLAGYPITTLDFEGYPVVPKLIEAEIFLRELGGEL